MAEYEFKIKVSAGKLSALHRAMSWLINNWEIESPHDDLLYHHAIEFKELFAKLMNNKQKKYGLRFNALQALAYCQMWDSNWKYLQTYEQATVFEMNGAIDRHRKHIKAISHGAHE